MMAVGIWFLLSNGISSLPPCKQLGVNIAQAVECRDFVRRKQEEEASQAAKRRKKEIAWGYSSSVAMLLFLFAIKSATLSSHNSVLRQ